jgi:hypothetical protein
MWECGEHDVRCRVGGEDALEERDHVMLGNMSIRLVVENIFRQKSLVACEIAHNAIHFLNF